jgi:hypothetical protein
MIRLSTRLASAKIDDGLSIEGLSHCQTLARPRNGLSLICRVRLLFPKYMFPISLSPHEPH